MSGRGLKGLVASVLLALVATPPASAETPTLKIAVLEFGTVNWELDTIDHYGLDNANGFEMDIRGVAGGSVGSGLAMRWWAAARGDDGRRIGLLVCSFAALRPELLLLFPLPPLLLPTITACLISGSPLPVRHPPSFAF